MSNKKEIRIYFNLDDPNDNFVYTLLKDRKKTPSTFIKHLIVENHEQEINKFIIADKLDLVIDAIKNLNTISIVPGEQTHTEEKEEFKFNLVDNFDDEY